VVDAGGAAMGGGMGGAERELRREREKGDGGSKGLARRMGEGGEKCWRELGERVGGITV